MIKTAHAWGISEIHLAVTYIFVTKEEVKKTSTELPSLGAVRVHGTMKTYAVMPVDDHIYIRDTSCFRSCYWSLDNFHPTRPGWIKRKTRNESGHETPNEQLQAQSTAEQVSQETQEPPTQQTEEPQSQVEETESSAVKEEGIRVGTFVAVRYSTKVYVGKVTEIDEEEINVTFMESFGNVEGCYRWPTRPDELWVVGKDILATLTSPAPTGRSQRAFRLCPLDAEIISHLY